MWSLLIAVSFASPVQVGDPAPPLEGVTWVAGAGPASWAELAGKVVVIDFWATSCGMCLASFPQVARLARSGDDVVVLALSGEETGAVERFLESDHGPAPKLVGAAGPAALAPWGDVALPMYAVIGPDGRIAAIQGDVPERDALASARVGEASGGRADVAAVARTFGPSTLSAEQTWVTLGRDRIVGEGLTSTELIEHASRFIGAPRHRYDVPLPAGRWDIDLEVDPREDLSAAAYERIGEGWGVSIAEGPVTVDAVVIDGARVTGLPVSEQSLCDGTPERGRTLPIRGCSPATLALRLERLLGVAVVVENAPNAAVDLALDWDEEDPVAAVSASLRELGFEVQREAREVDGLVVSAR